ncbi:MAG: hypothetical protein LLG00_09405 [Planctomycetaceae bacterium]|nr:hypothetical protein [Planctomycetaceae bacterium]
MRRVIMALSMAVSVMALPQCLAAADGKQPERPRPEMKRQQPAPRPRGADLERRGDAKGKCPGHQTQTPDAKAMFNRLDTNKDGALSFDEFSEGVRRLHRKIAMQARAWSASDCFAEGPHAAVRPGEPCGGNVFFTKKPRCVYQPGQGWAAQGQRGPWSYGMRHHRRHHFACAMNDGCRGRWHRQGHMTEFRVSGCSSCTGECCCPRCSRSSQGWRSHECMTCYDGFHGRHGAWQRPYWAFGHQQFERPYCMEGYRHHYHQHAMDGRFEGREFSRRMDGFEGRQGPERPHHKDAHQGHKKPEAKKSDAKKPEAKKADVKKPERKAVSSDRSVEARLTSLENQQAAILVALHEQQAAVMTALQQTNDLINARLAGGERPQSGYRAAARQSRPERETRELSLRFGGESRSHDRQDDDRD